MSCGQSFVQSFCQSFVRTNAISSHFLPVLNIIVRAPPSELLQQVTDVLAYEIGHSKRNRKLDRANQTQISGRFRLLPAASNDSVRNNLGYCKARFISTEQSPCLRLVENISHNSKYWFLSRLCSKWNGKQSSSLLGRMWSFFTTVRYKRYKCSCSSPLSHRKRSRRQMFPWIQISSFLLIQSPRLKLLMRVWILVSVFLQICERCKYTLFYKNV